MLHTLLHHVVLSYWDAVLLYVYPYLYLCLCLHQCYAVSLSQQWRRYSHLLQDVGWGISILWPAIVFTETRLDKSLFCKRGGGGPNDTAPHATKVVSDEPISLHLTLTRTWRFLVFVTIPRTLLHVLVFILMLVLYCIICAFSLTPAEAVFSSGARWWTRHFQMTLRW